MRLRRLLRWMAFAIAAVCAIGLLVLARRGGRRRGRGEQRDEAEQEREQSWHRESEPLRRRADAVFRS